MKSFHLILIGGLVLFAAGCAEITVTKVTPDNEANVEGIQYCLPKPLLQVSPRLDGTVAVDLIHLPDNSNRYAIDTYSWMSSSSFQVALDSGGLLSAVEYKQNTSAVGQQVATSAGAGAAEFSNLQAQQNVANQSAVNTAQAGVDTGKSAVDADQAQLNSDNNVLTSATANLASVKGNPASSATDIATAQAALTAAQNSVNTDNGNLAQAQAKYQDAKETLGRVQSTSQAIAFNATPGSAITPTIPTLGTTGFGPQTWTTPPGYDLPEKHGAILYAIDEGVDATTKKPYVKLMAVKWPDGKAQEDFNTIDIAHGSPVLGPQNMRYPLSGNNAVFYFDRPIDSIANWTVSTVTPPTSTVVTAAQAPALDPSGLTVTLPLSLTTPPGGTFKPGNYQISLIFKWGGSHSQVVTLLFTVTSP